MIRFIRYLILAVIALGLVVMAMANWQKVSLTVLPEALEGVVGWNFTTPEIPLFLIILGSIGVGLLGGYVFEWIRESKHRSEAAKRQRQVRNLSREMDQIKKDGNQGKDEVLALLDNAPRKAAS